MRGVGAPSLSFFILRNGDQSFFRWAPACHEITYLPVLTGLGDKLLLSNMIPHWL